ncbi:MAG TPA: hypothetical protein VG347_05645, partial [Verrucomicrobiae bacterium]|nr:hypothetical protein [Verrucomicrobiae bacterium]
NIISPTDKAMALMTATNLLSEQLSGYTFISNGQVGDQPGQHVYRYLDTWQALPQGTFVAAQKFFLPGGTAGAYYDIPQWETDNSGRLDNTWRTGQSGVYCFNTVMLPFPTEQSPQVPVPVIAFDYLGRLISETPDGNSFHHAYIPLAQGTVGYGYDGATKTALPTVVQPSDIVENPAGNSTGISYNVIDIDPLTGRAKLQFFKIQ